MPRIRFAPFARHAPLDVARWSKHASTGSKARALRHETYRMPLPSSRAPDEGFADYKAAIAAYDIFPAGRMEAAIGTPHGHVEIGALIAQRVFVGPLALEMAVRVTAVTDEPHRFAFEYETLEGHAERGRARFTLRQDGGAMTLIIDVWSQPGALLSRMVAPFARMMQKRATKEALDHVASMLDRQALVLASEQPASAKRAV